MFPLFTYSLTPLLPYSLTPLLPYFPTPLFRSSGTSPASSRCSGVMEIRGFLLFWSILAAVMAALSVGPSFAHVLESAPRLTKWSPSLWRETTVFNAQFQLFAVIGAPLDVAAIGCPGLLAWMLRNDRPAFWYALAAAVLYAVSLAMWFALVKPANDILATWMPGPIPENFEAIRLRWETGHMIVAGFKAVGFVSLVVALLWIRRG